MGGNGNLVGEAQFHQGLPLEVGMGLDLVRGGRDARVAQDVADQEHVIVAAWEYFHFIGGGGDSR